MNPNASPSRLVSGAAVIAVSVAALGAAWMGGGQVAAPAELQAGRPAADAPVRVVKAPASEPTRQPVKCIDCALPVPTEQRL